MFFFPYRVDLNILRFPLVTLLTMLICAFVYWAQVHDDSRQAAIRASICASIQNSGRMAMAEFHSADGSCEGALETLLEAPNPQQLIDDTAARAERNSTSVRGWGDIVNRVATDALSTMRERVTKPPLTERLLYRPESWNPWHAVTAAFAHANLTHLLGNLFFFYVFAATVEAILGSLRFALSLAIIAIGSHFCYSLVNLGIPAPPTVGLSGVVMGMMGFFAWAMPTARMRVAYWFLIRFGVVNVPAWLLAIWYVGLDAYRLYNHAGGNVNLVAHVSGAAIGVALAMTFFRRPVAEAREFELAP